jgi:3,4-dihydroxy 2-butanone 4-phosphate synthase/GTP cyclohydrolase II
MDTVDANIHLGFAPDLRHYGVGAQILSDLGVRKIRLLTNNPKKLIGLESFGLELVERMPLVVPANPDNVRYLESKRAKMGHLLGRPDNAIGE